MFPLALPTKHLTVAGVLFAIGVLGARHAYRMFKSQKAPDLPSPGWRKQDPKELDKLLTTGLEDSMAASDPVSVTQPDVHRR